MATSALLDYCARLYYIPDVLLVKVLATLILIGLIRLDIVGNSDVDWVSDPLDIGYTCSSYNFAGGNLLHGKARNSVLLPIQIH